MSSEQTVVPLINQSETTSHKEQSSWAQDLKNLVDVVKQLAPNVLALAMATGLELTVQKEAPVAFDTTHVVAVAPINELHSPITKYFHAYGKTEEEPSVYRQVYSSATASEEQHVQEVDVTPKLNFDDVKNYVRSAKMKDLGCQSTISFESKKQWELFTSSIEGLCWSRLMYDLAV